MLQFAEDETIPLLERTRFLAIFTSNLDEFFMVRVAGLKRRIAAGVAVRAASGLMPREVLDQIWDKSADLMSRHARVFSEEIIPALKQEHIVDKMGEQEDLREQAVANDFDDFLRGKENIIIGATMETQDETTATNYFLQKLLDDPLAREHATRLVMRSLYDRYVGEAAA